MCETLCYCGYPQNMHDKIQCLELHAFTPTMTRTCVVPSGDEQKKQELEEKVPAAPT